jgi:diaminopimelate decarboxylase
VPELRVNFDSLTEARALAATARQMYWSCGVRLQTRGEHDPQDPSASTQFGMERKEAIAAMEFLAKAKVRLETVHFHLRTNVPRAEVYESALVEVARTCAAAGFHPLYIDCGGGFPPRHVADKSGAAVAREFDFAAMARVYERALRRFPGAREIWLENGRWLTARSGVLVTKILDVKERRGMRHLICDGGRTLHAMVSNWEEHEILSMPSRIGPSTPTTISGPTCMAFDQLARGKFCEGLRAGDRLIWMEAGAYHLSWETRFSHGLAPVLWHDGVRIREVRARERFEHWWGQWVR